MECDCLNHIFHMCFIKTTQVLLKTFERSTRGCLGTSREDFKTTQRLAGVPSNLGIIQVFWRTCGLWNLGMLGDYSPRPSRLLENILLDYKVLMGLPYGHPWAHYSGGYQDQLLSGPLGQLNLGCTAQGVVKHKGSRGLVSVRRLGMPGSM
jgi:hypothetical protein